MADIKPPGFWESLAANLGRPGQVQGFNLMSPFYGLTREGKAAGTARIAEGQRQTTEAQGATEMVPGQVAAGNAQNSLATAGAQSAQRLIPGQEAVAETKNQASLADMRELVRLVTEDPSKNPSATSVARIMADLMDGKLDNEAKQFGLAQQKQTAADVQGITGTTPAGARELMAWRQGQAGTENVEANTAGQVQQNRAGLNDMVVNAGGYMTPQGAQAGAIPKETAQRQQQIDQTGQAQRMDNANTTAALSGFQGLSPQQIAILEQAGMKFPKAGPSPEQAAAQRAQAANSRAGLGTNRPQQTAPPAQNQPALAPSGFPFTATNRSPVMQGQPQAQPAPTPQSVFQQNGQESNPRATPEETLRQLMGLEFQMQNGTKSTNDLKKVREMIRQLKAQAAKGAN
jgi:hypothetical protein